MTMKRTSSFLALVQTAALLAACGSGETGGVPDSAGTALVPTLASIQENVFTPTCAGCHTGSGAPGGLRLDSGFSYDSMVEVVSPTYNLFRVAPGNPDNSLLILKLEGDPTVGQQMPQGSSLPQETIDVIRQWIANGAPES